MQRRHQGLHAGLLENSGPGSRLKLDSRLPVLDNACFGVEVSFKAGVRRLLFCCRLVHLRVLERSHLHTVLSSMTSISTCIQISHG